MLSLLTESWTWYTIACLIVISRYASRWLQFGTFRRVQAEDYVMIIVFVFYTVLIIFMNEVAHLDTNLMLPSDIPLLTPTSIKSRIHGSKLVLVVEQSMIMTIWGCKICLLLMYNQMTLGLKQHFAVKLVAGYVVVNFVVMEILYLGVWCRPFQNYWSVPVDNVQCSAALHHLITNAVFNITSDVMMLCIPLPLLMRSQLPTAKKFILCCLFGLGVFVILCAILNKYYSFHAPFAPTWTFWYIREASTAIYVANIPMCWTLLRRLFNLRSFNGSSNSGGRSRSKSVPIATTYSQTGTKSKIGNSSKLATLVSVNRPVPSGNTSQSGAESRNGDVSWWERDQTTLQRSESEEFIIQGSKGVSGNSLPLEIWESRQVTVQTNSIAPGVPMGLRSHDSDEGIKTGMYDGNRKEFETKTVIIASGTSSEEDRSVGGGQSEDGKKRQRST